MADTQISTSNLKIVAEFKDSDDRTLTLDNPNWSAINSDKAAYITSIKAAETIAKNGNLLIGDKAGADFLRFKGAHAVRQTKTFLDLSDVEYSGNQGN